MLTLMAVAAFVLHATKDPITDKAIAYAISENGRAALAIGCDYARRGGVNVVLLSDRVVLGGQNRLTGEKLVKWRFDDRRPQSSIWEQSASAAMLSGSAWVADFIRDTLKSRKVVVRTTRYDGGDVDFDFDLSGAEGPVREMIEFCGDKKLASKVFTPE